MYDSIQYILQRECKFDTNNLVMLGVSGGPDSLCLLHALHTLGYKLITVHINHGLRPEADEEAHAVQLVAERLGVEHITQKVDVRAYAAEQRVSIEEAARILRYQFLFQQAEAFQASAVMVGHTADDQIETILMHLLRGSGLAGLHGMEILTLPNAWSDKVPLIRPLLLTWRREIHVYLHDHGLEPIMDQSNLDKTFFRNRLRLELLPLLESYNPHIRQILLQTGQSLADDFDLLQQLTKNALETLLTVRENGYRSYHLAGFLELPRSLQRSFLRQAIAVHLVGLRDVDYDCIERSLKLLAGEKHNGEIDLISGLRLHLEGEYFWISTPQRELIETGHPSISPGVKLQIEIPSKISLCEGWELSVKYSQQTEETLEVYSNIKNPYEAWMDIAQLEHPLQLRARLPGDRIKPFGLNGHTLKISDLMINMKMPKRVRATWPLICSGKEILWVPGCMLSILVKVKPASRQVIHLSLSRTTGT